MELARQMACCTNFLSAASNTVSNFSLTSESQVEEMTIKVELLENKAKLLDMQSNVKAPAEDFGKSSETLEDEV